MKGRVSIPAAYREPEAPVRTTTDGIRRAFAGANPGLTPERLTISCSDGGRFLREVFFCFDARGERPVACSAEMRRQEAKSCRRGDLLIRNVR